MEDIGILILRCLKDLKIYHKVLYLSGENRIIKILNSEPLMILSTNKTNKGWAWDEQKEKWEYWCKKNLLLYDNILDKLNNNNSQLHKTIAPIIQNKVSVFKRICDDKEALMIIKVIENKI